MREFCGRSPVVTQSKSPAKEKSKFSKGIRWKTGADRVFLPPSLCAIPGSCIGARKARALCDRPSRACSEMFRTFIFAASFFSVFAEFWMTPVGLSDMKDSMIEVQLKSIINQSDLSGLTLSLTLGRHILDPQT